MDIVVSGARPTGFLHLGNYFGAVRNFVELQSQLPAYFFVADLHSLTTHPKADDLHNNVRQILAEYLACGLDPKTCTLYVQSDIPEISQLYLLFNMLAYKGELERSTTYKDKVAKQQDNINAGLLTYPVLMAVDIIIHKATKVPVGKDQQQHLEMTRQFANRFNHMYGVDYFPEPEAFNFDQDLVKVPSLDGSGKMSKSSGDKSCIHLADAPEVILKKVKKAKTVAGPELPNSPMPEEIQNLFALMELVSDASTIAHFKSTWNDCSIRFGDMKKQLGEDMVAFTQPIYEQIEYYKNNDALLREITQEGAAKARKSAAQTLKDVQEIIGIRAF